MHIRYIKEEMGRIWDDNNRFRTWTEVEVAVLIAKQSCGLCLVGVKIPEDLAESIVVDPAEVYKIEFAGLGHELMAYLQITQEQLPEHLKSHWHREITSFDIQDTAMALQLVESVELFQGATERLMGVVKTKALKYKNTPMIGRSHGVHGEPIDFGVKLANWYDELKRHREDLERLKKVVAVGKISGAMGMFNLDPRVEKKVCELLGLKPIISTQIISRDIVARYLSTIAIIGGTIQKIAVTVRRLQQTEIMEAQEYFDPKKRKGSSAMPHKRNPIGSENLYGMARLLRAYDHVGKDNQETWDERTLENSGVERIILPDASNLLYYMLTRLAGIIDKWIIYPDKMLKNIDLTRGLVFSQDVQVLLAEKSKLPRETAYEIVKDIAQDCFDRQADFLQMLLEDEKITKWVTEDELRVCFDLEPKLKHVNHIFKQVFGKEE